MEIERAVGPKKCVLKTAVLARAGVGCFAALFALTLLGALCWADSRTPEEVKAPDTFESCIAAGGRLQRERGARCTTPTGQVFEQPTKAARAACKDLCGDGKCQEIVCMAVGCPCPESTTTCPADCKK